jgi:hypothetical protein
MPMYCPRFRTRAAFDSPDVLDVMKSMHAVHQENVSAGADLFHLFQHRSATSTSRAEAFILSTSNRHAGVGPLRSELR